MEQSAVSTFVSHIERGRDLWRSIDLRCISAKKEDEWFNLHTRAYLSSCPPQQIVRFTELPSTDRIKALQHVFPIDDLQRVLSEIGNGALQVGGSTVYFLHLDPNRSEPPRKYSPVYYFSDISTAYQPSYPYWSAHSLFFQAGSYFDMMSAFGLDWRNADDSLRLHKTPYDGLQGLARSFEGFPDVLESNRTLGAEFFAPIESQFRVDGCYIEDAHVNYQVRAGSRAAAHDTDIGFTAVGVKPIPHAGRASIPKTKWKKLGSEYVATGRFRVKQDRIVTLMLRTAAFSVQKLQLAARDGGALNTRSAAYQEFDPSFSILKEWLSTTRGSNRAEDFERAVARLFVLAGFSVDLLGGGRGLTDAPDAIAYDDATPAIVVIECTTGPLEASGKRGKLTARLADIAAMNPTRRRIGVLATSLTSSAVSTSDRDAALNDGLVVLAREDLVESLKAIEAGVTAPRFLNMLLAESRRRLEQIKREGRLPLS